MALDVDGFAVLRAIAQTPDAFPDIAGDVPKAARALVAKQLKARGLTLPGLHRLHASLGAENLALILDGLSDAEVKSLVTRLDRNNPDLKTAGPDWHRHQLAALAQGGDQTAANAQDEPPAAPQAERALGNRPFAATWDGKDHDVPEKSDDASEKGEKKKKKKKKG